MKHQDAEGNKDVLDLWRQELNLPSCKGVLVQSRRASRQLRTAPPGRNIVAKRGDTAESAISVKGKDYYPI
jgi:hypothetical protein